MTHKAQCYKNSISKWIVTGSTFLVVCALQWISLELSITAFHDILARSFFRSLLSYSVVVGLNATFLFLIGRFSLTQVITGLLCCIFSVTNHYVLLWHSSPLRASEFRSFLTALNVIQGYTFSIDRIIKIVLLLFFLQILFHWIYREAIHISWKHWLLRIWAIVLLSTSVVIITIGFSSDNWRPAVGWSWDSAAKISGYPACLIEDTIQFVSRYKKPDEYSEKVVQEYVSKIDADSFNGNAQTYPDIILILNETFYDPIVYERLGLKTDIPFLESFYQTENAMRGYNAIPYIGTNCTEYELLTSNSKVLINPGAPFNFFPLSEANSIVRYLKVLGYETWAFHNAEPENYSRNIAYPALGFDHVSFYSDFLPEEYYGNRRATDLHDYKQLIKAYEEASETPRFMYMLTIQNHGGYEQNPEEYDLVHAQGDYGEYTDDMNEFLTCISMSDSAWRELIDYFSEVDRDVIVIMTGDHPPSFLFELSRQEFAENDDFRSFALNNMTPYIIWSNYLNLETQYQYISCSDLIPLALSCTGMPLSRYYEQILALQEKLPIHMDGCFFDKDGNCFNVLNDTEAQELLKDYLFMEYNNLMDLDVREQRLFDPIPAANK